MLYNVCDISRHQGEIEFAVMRAQGVEGVAIRATVGDYYTDPRFYEYWGMAGVVGLRRTAYHVTRPGSGIKAQVKRFLDVVGYRMPDFGKIGWVVDNEKNDKKPRSEVTKVVWYCLNELSNRIGVPAGNYTRAGWWNEWVKPASTWKQFIMWVARYSTRIKQPWLPTSPSYLIPHSYDDWGAWQWSADGNKRGEEFGVIPEPGAPPPSIDINRVKSWVFDGAPTPEPEPEPVESEWDPGPVEVIAPDGLFVRLVPNVEYRTRIGGLSRGARPWAFERKKVNGNVVYKIGDNLWIFGEYGGKVLAEPGKRYD